ncbi:unnamed protein product [Periconia digitata]|uniref:BTB domain-containing protein n=1 Tax=Periconia digitata TaxID=1303443 RepID=A0A9W4UUR1_9PLEO|nr:unnamed protein product [Periconia digitata]
MPPRNFHYKGRGLHRYCNSEQHSDIKIRYGLQGENVFHGHKVILSVASDWFKNALGGNFSVRNNSNRDHFERR